jgi:hypothetical protein
MSPPFSPRPTPHDVSRVLATTFLLTAAITLGISRGTHLAWPVFLLIGGIGLYAATT